MLAGYDALQLFVRQFIWLGYPFGQLYHLHKELVDQLFGGPGAASLPSLVVVEQENYSALRSQCIHQKLLLLL